jgi:hypothetical protein
MFPAHLSSTIIQFGNVLLSQNRVALSIGLEGIQILKAFIWFDRITDASGLYMENTGAGDRENAPGGFPESLNVSLRRLCFENRTIARFWVGSLLKDTLSDHHFKESPIG